MAVPHPRPTDNMEVARRPSSVPPWTTQNGDPVLPMSPVSADVSAVHQTLLAFNPVVMGPLYWRRPTRALPLKTRPSNLINLINPSITMRVPKLINLVVAAAVVSSLDQWA